MVNFKGSRKQYFFQKLFKLVLKMVSHFWNNFRSVGFKSGEFSFRKNFKKVFVSKAVSTAVQTAFYESTSKVVALTLTFAIVDDVEVAVGEGECEGTAQAIDGKMALGETLAHYQRRREYDVLDFTTLGRLLTHRVQDADAIGVNQGLPPRLCVTGDTPCDDQGSGFITLSNIRLKYLVMFLTAA